MNDMAIMSRQLANYLLSHNCKLNKIVPHHNDKTKLVFYFEHTATVDELMDKYNSLQLFAKIFVESSILLIDRNGFGEYIKRRRFYRGYRDEK